MVESSLSGLSFLLSFLPLTLPYPSCLFFLHHFFLFSLPPFPAFSPFLPYSQPPLSFFLCPFLSPIKDLWWLHWLQLVVPGMAWDFTGKMKELCLYPIWHSGVLCPHGNKVLSEAGTTSWGLNISSVPSPSHHQHQPSAGTMSCLDVPWLPGWFCPSVLGSPTWKLSFKEGERYAKTKHLLNFEQLANDGRLILEVFL